jgi:hypothetical protein
VGLKWSARTQVVREYRELYRYLWDLSGQWDSSGGWDLSDQPALKWLGYKEPYRYGAYRCDMLCMWTLSL